MELFNILSLKEIADIISTLGESHRNIYHMCGTIRLDNKVIFYENKDNELRIQSSTGEKTAIRISYSSKETEDYNRRKMTILCHECFIDYYLRDGSIISLYNKLSLPKGYDGFENVQRQDLINGLRIKYYDKDGIEGDFPLTSDITISISANKICLDGHKVFEFTDKGIKYSNYLITLKGDKLVLSGAPSLEDAKSFDLEKEKERIEKFAKMDCDIHPFTKEVLETAARTLSGKQRTADSVKTFYEEDIKDVRRAIKIRTDFIRDIENGILSSKELEQVARRFRQEVKGKSYHK